jgi:tol-pal system-associated acyl-CoA thioesterase
MNNCCHDQAVFYWPIRVYYEDTDAGGLVYHGQYLNFMERARTEWLRSLGFEQTAVRALFNTLFVVHSMQIQFKKAARFDDLLLVGTQLTRLKLGSFECSQTIVREQEVIMQAQVKIACVNGLTYKPTGIPAPIKRSLESI